MADTGWVLAGAGASINTGAQGWSSPSRITADDGSWTFAFGAGVTDDLRGSAFGLSVPANNIITGIAVRIRTRYVVSAHEYRYVNVGKSDAALGTPKDPGVALALSPGALLDQGGDGDLWGLTWSVAEVNSATFQARIRAENMTASDGTAEVDAMWIKVFYAPAALMAGAGSFILDGKNVGIGAGASVAGTAGVFSLSGQAVGLVYDLGYFIAAEVGSFLVEVVTEAVLTFKQTIARTVKTTYDVRPLLRKFRRSAPRLEE